MSELTIPQRVDAGAAYLDEHRPGWWQRTDVDGLDLTNPCHCVLGQEYGSFWAVPPLKKYEVDGPFGDDELAEVLAFAVPLGFDSGDDEGWGQVAELTAEWRRLIESRRSGEDGWRDDVTGLVSGGLVASCSVCGHIDESEPHDCGEVS